MAETLRSQAADAGVTVHALPARLDLSNTRQTVQPIREGVERGELRVVLDFSATQAVDSTALGAIVQVYKAVRARGGDLVLCAVGDPVRRVLSITRLDQVLVVCETREEAVRRLAP